MRHRYGSVTDSPKSSSLQGSGPGAGPEDGPSSRNKNHKSEEKASKQPCIIYFLCGFFAFLLIATCILLEPNTPSLYETIDCNDSEYLCADWSPTIHLFSSADSESHVVCLKQMNTDAKKIEVKTHMRGHVSVLFPKKQLDMTVSKSTKFLSQLPVVTHFVIGAPFIDTSYMRNTFTFDLFEKMGGLSLPYQYLDLYSGAEDQGLHYAVPHPIHYLWKVEHPDAIVVFDWCKDSPCFKPGIYSTQFSITKWKNDQALKEGKDLMQAFATAVQQGIGISQIVDLKSLVRSIIIEELAKDIDGYVFSNYFYVKKGKIFHGPVWDWHMGYGFMCDPMYFTNQFGQALTGVEGWHADTIRHQHAWVDHIVDEGVPNYRDFFLALFHTPEVYAEFQREWKLQRAGPLSDESVVAYLAATTTEITWGAVRDQVLWSNEYRCSLFHCCDPVASTNFGASATNLQDWILARTKWIDENIDTISTEPKPVQL